MTTISELTRGVHDRSSAAALVEESLQRIDRLEPQLHCLLSSDRQFITEQLDDLGERLQSGEHLRLAGLPIIVKDNLCIRGSQTTCGSRMLEGFLPPYDATVWQKLKAAGAILVGKANMDEFAMGSSTENSAFGPTHNPWALDRVPGGSSGGSAAAVAAGYALAALGTDTGGSIRQPAAFCGITGLKPTYGRVSRYGLIAFASSLDQVGPLTRSAVDAALVFSVLAGFDPKDATSSDKPLSPHFINLESAPSLRGVKLAIPGAVYRLLHERARASFEVALDELRRIGVGLEKVEVPFLEEALSAYYVIAPAEASSNLARYDGIRFGPPHTTSDFANVAELTMRTRSTFFGSEVKRRIMLGTYTLSAGYYEAFYHRAQQVRTALRQAYEAIFSQGFLAVLTPTTPGPAFVIGEKTSDPVAMYLSDALTVAANLTGLPALSIPSGFSSEGLPLGLQLQGPAFSELDLLTLARDYQRATPHHLSEPPISHCSPN